MLKRVFSLFMFAVLAALVSTSGAAAKSYASEYIRPVYNDFDSGRWTNIGCKRADFIDNRYVMQVERNQGPFDKLRLKISSANFHVIGLKVVFYNGDRAKLVVKSEDSYPGRGIILHMNSRGRYLKKVIMHYGSRVSSFEPIVVCVDGHEISDRGGNSGGGYGGGYGSGGNDDDDDDDDRGGYGQDGGYSPSPMPVPRHSKWKNLGCMKAKHSTKSRYVRVGRSKGRFKALRFIGGSHRIKIKSVIVTFGNGRKKNLGIRQTVGRRAHTAINYIGSRFISVVDVRLKTKILFAKSRLCLQGLPAGGRSGNDYGGGSYNPAPTPAPTSGKWTNFGCRSFSDNSRFISRFIPIGKYRGAFSAIRLRVTGRNMILKNLGVVYGNGRSKVLTNRKKYLMAGDKTRAFRFPRPHRLKEVEVIGRKLGGRGRDATVCVQLK